MDRIRRFMATPLAVVVLFGLIVVWTWLVLGADAAWRMAAVLAGLGAADIAIGWGRGLTLSEAVNHSWHRDPRRYWLWLIGIGAGLILLHLHFTGV